MGEVPRLRVDLIGLRGSWRLLRGDGNFVRVFMALKIVMKGEKK